MTRHWVWLLVPAFTTFGALVPLVGIVRGPAIHAWTALPFLLLGLLAASHLRSAPRSLVLARLSALLSAFITLLLLGWWCHKPAASPGMNFGVAFFPIYAIFVAPLGYGLGWAVAHMCHAKSTDIRGEHL